jgi:hypothetical protein
MDQDAVEQQDAAEQQDEVEQQDAAEQQEQEDKADQNDLSLEELNSISEQIEAMNHFNQVEVLRILHSYENIQLNENKYGIHVNLTCLKKEVLEKVKLYISYVNKQETDLNEVERQKETFKNTYFNKIE